MKDLYGAGKRLAEMIAAISGVRTEFGPAGPAEDGPLAVVDLRELSDNVHLGGLGGEVFATLVVGLYGDPEANGTLQEAMDRVESGISLLRGTSLPATESGQVWRLAQIAPAPQLGLGIEDEPPHRIDHTALATRQYRIVLRTE